MSGAIVITGASSGIGLEASVYLAKQGLRVVATMRDPRKSTELELAATKASVKIDVVALDVTDRVSIARAVDDIITRHGAIAALVNNAGIQIRGFFEDLSEEEVRKVFETNVFGAMAVTRAVLPHMRKAGAGRIVFLSSVGGLIGSPGLSAYCASKFAIEGFGETLALELGLFGIAVSIIEPGIVNTEIWKSNMLVAEGSNASSPYHRFFEESEKMARWAVETSPIRTRHVAQAIQHAVTAKSPKRRYLIGSRPGVVLFLRRFVPPELFGRIYSKAVTSRLARAGSQST